MADGSTARQRHLEHVTNQTLDVMRREEIGVLFITPPALAALAARLSVRQSEAIHGIHYGGMSLTPETVNDFRTAFPRAVHLAGYGNTLFGVVMQGADGVLERDQTERVALSSEAIELGGHADGLRNPQAPPTLVGRLQMGLY